MKKPTSMELASQDFHQRIVGKYVDFLPFTRKPSPLVSTKGFALFLSRWLELVYAMPYAILRREMLTSLKETRTNIIAQPIEQIWNILVNLEGSTLYSQYGQHPSYSGDRFLAELKNNIYLSMQQFHTVRPQNIAFPGLAPMSAGTPLVHQRSEVTHTTHGLLQGETQEGKQRIYHYGKLSPEGRLLTGSPEGESPSGRGSGDTPEPISPSPYIPTKSEIWQGAKGEGAGGEVAKRPPQMVGEHAEAESRAQSIPEGLPATTHPLPVTGRPPLTLSYEPPVSISQPTVSSLKTSFVGQPSEEAQQPPIKEPGAPAYTSSQEARVGGEEKVGQPQFPYSYFVSGRQRQGVALVTGARSRWGGVLLPPKEAFRHYQLNLLELGRVEAAYSTYPRMETVGTVTSRETPGIRKEEKVREIEAMPRPPQPPKVDVDRIADQVYRLIERKIRIERERRGL